MRKKSALIALVILALGLIGTSLSTLYKQNEHVGDITARIVTFKVSYGFPLSWYGYSRTSMGMPTFSPIPEIYWFSLESLLLDAAFWFAISFSVCIATMKSVNMLRKARASKILSVIDI
jgi:hypothetical protein